MAEVKVIVESNEKSHTWLLPNKHMDALYNWLDWAEKQRQLDETREQAAQGARKRHAKT